MGEIPQGFYVKNAMGKIPQTTEIGNSTRKIPQTTEIGNSTRKIPQGSLKWWGFLMGKLLHKFLMLEDFRGEIPQRSMIRNTIGKFPQRSEILGNKWG